MVYCPRDNLVPRASPLPLLSCSWRREEERPWERGWSRESNHFGDVITKAVLSPKLFKDPECWSSQGV